MTDLDYDWWEFVYEDFKDNMTEKGFDVDLTKTYFDHMYSQGQGAGFTADLDTRKFLEAHDLTSTYPHIMMLLNAGGGIATWIRARDTYSIVEIDTHDYLEDTLDTNIPIIEHCVEEWDRQLEGEMDRFEHDLREHVDGYCHDLMRDLITEYEFLCEEEEKRRAEEELEEAA